MLMVMIMMTLMIVMRMDLTISVTMLDDDFAIHPCNAPHHLCIHPSIHSLFVAITINIAIIIPLIPNGVHEDDDDNKDDRDIARHHDVHHHVCYPQR